MTNSLLDICATLSDVVYRPDTHDLSLYQQQIQGYTQLPIAIEEADLGTGFYAEAWYNVQTKSVIIAIRGTDFNAPTMVDFTEGNVPLAFGDTIAGVGNGTSADAWSADGLQPTGQLAALHNFVNQVRAAQPDSDITFTGHSLGGGLATIAGVYYDEPVVAFSPAPFMNLIQDFRFIPEGVPQAIRDVIEGAINEFYSTYNAADLASGDPISAMSAAQSALMAFPGYVEADQARDLVITTRYSGAGDQIENFRIAGEVLGEYFVTEEGRNQISSYFSLPSLGSLAAEAFSITSSETVSVGGADWTFGQSLALHSMALHQLVLETDFETFLLSNDLMRNMLLDGSWSPMSTVTADSKTATRDSSILYRAWILDGDFRQAFVTSWETVNDSAIAPDLYGGLAEFMLQKATVFTDAWRLNAVHGTFSPLIQNSNEFIAFDMADIDTSGVKIAHPDHPYALGRATFDIQFRSILEAAFVDKGATVVSAEDYANNLLGIDLAEAAGSPWMLNWTSVAVANSTGSTTYSADGLGASLIFGGIGENVIHGSAFQDFISGGAGDDVIEGAGGADILIGGSSGNVGDTVSYAASLSGVSVDLGQWSATQSGGDAEGDTLFGFENIIGSSHADHLRGDDNVNRLRGAGGDDFFYVEGNGSAATGDTFDGGDGFDTINLSAANDLGVIPGLEAKSIRYTVDLGQGHLQGGEDSDVWTNLVSVENVEGSAYADQIFGDDGQNHLSGGAGNDFITGGGGNDVIVGGGDWNPNDTEVDTVCFSGAWSDYTITMSYGLDGILSYISVADRIADRDGVDAVYSCEWFQFQGTLLRYDQVANNAPTDVSLVGGVWNLIEDGFGEQATASVIATLTAADMNNTYVDGAPIDTAAFTLSPESSAYYEISGNEIVKKSFSIDYEAWYAEIHSIYDAIISPAGVTFSAWLEDIADGVSSIRQADVIAALEWPYKLLVTATDSGGLSYTKSLIVSVGNLSGLIEGTNGNDMLLGTSEDDVIHGLDGNDVLVGGIGADSLFGGLGIDTASYAGSTARVVVKLSTGVGSGGDAQGDILNMIENLTGSDYGDSLTGDDSANVLTGGKGDDFIYGGGGTDTVVFSGTWAQYRVFGARIMDKISGRDGMDTVSLDVESYRFSDVTLSAAQLRNVAPTIALSGLGSFNEDIYGEASSAKAVASVLVSDANNANSEGVVIDHLTLELLPESVPYYELVGDTVYKSAGYYLDYEIWRSAIYSAYSSITSLATAESFETFLIDIKDGSSSYYNTEFLNALGAPYKISIKATDSGGLSTQIVVIGSVDNVSGTIIGTEGADVLFGTSEDDIVNGLGGDDVLDGGYGPDRLSGGIGSDTASYAQSDAGVSVNLITGAAVGGHAQGDILVEIENLTGSAYVDTLTGDDSNNVLSGLAGNDILNGGGGDDVIRPGAGNDRSDGGAGVDTLDYSSSNSQVTIDLQSGDVGEYGVSYVEKAYNFENVTSTNYNDTLYGTPGDNSFQGFGGNDNMYGRGGSDTFDGGSGLDIVSWNYSSAAFVKVNLETGELDGEAANDILTSIEGAEGTAGDDILIGNGEANTFYGLGGNDVLRAGDGSGTGIDILVGGAGDDQLFGGTGKSTLDGGAGEDYIVPGLGADAIQDSDFVTVDYSSADSGIQIRWNSYNERLEGHSSIAEGDRFYSSWLKYMTLIGTDFDDTIDGRPFYKGDYNNYPMFGDETIYAGKGNDIVNVSSGNNIVYGGEGNDVISAAQFVDTRINPEVDKLYGESGNDTITGGAGADFLYGGSGWDWIDAGTDTDVDTVDFGENGGGLKFTSFGSANDGYGINVDLTTMSIAENRLGSAPVAGYWLNDVITGTVTGVWGTALNDIIVGSGLDDRIIAGGGTDVIHSGAGNDYIGMDGSSTAWGEDGDDQIEVGNGQATIYGGNGNDVIYGGRGSDNLFGDAGDDVLYAWNPHLAATNAETSGAINHLTGGAGIDTMFGGQGQDFFHSLDDGDIIYGYFRETLDFSSSDHGVVYNAVSGTTSRGTVATNIYSVIGSEFSDEFFGVSTNSIHGGGGADVFRGPGAFYGDAGDDTFYAPETGNIIASGGAGNDVYVSSSIYGSYNMDEGDDTYIANHNHGTDNIGGFDVGLGSGDRIVLSSSYLVKDGSTISVEQFIDEKAHYDSYYNYTYIALGDTTIRLTGGNFVNQLHSDDFLFV